MAPDLTDADRDRFARLRERIEGVAEAERSESARLPGFQTLDPVLAETFEGIEDRPVPVSEVRQPYTPIEPGVVRVKYQEITRELYLRAPVYLGPKPDAPTDVVTQLDADT